MRLLAISHHAPPHVGGLENLVAMEVSALLDAGHEVVWITSDLLGAGHTPQDHDRLKVVRVPAWHGIERWFSIAYPIYSPRLIPLLWRYVGWADVVHAHGFVFLCTVAALITSRFRGKDCILTDHGGMLYYRSKLATLGLRIAIETLGRCSVRCDITRLVSYNADVSDLLARLAGGDDKLRLIPNPVDYRKFFLPTVEQRQTARVDLGWTDGRKKVLFVGRLVTDKGIDRLLDVTDPAYDLVFCGPAEPDVVQRVMDRGAQYLNPRPQADLLKVYQAADSFALPSWNEGFPVVIQEALACGLPVVTYDHRAYRPYQGVPNLYFCQMHPDSLRASIQESLSNERTRVAGANTADTIEAFPDLQTWLDTLLAEMGPSSRKS